MDNIPSVIQAKGLLGGSAEKSLPAKQEMGVQSPGQAGDGGSVPGSGRRWGSVPGSGRRWGFSPRVKQEMGVQSLGQEDQKQVATHSSILAWETPLTKESGGLQPMG